MKLFVRTWGEPDLPRSAALVHGIAGAAGSWWRVAGALVERGYSCAAPDLRGHGHSAKTPGQYSIPLMAADLGESLPPEPDLLAGFSLGGGLVILAVLEGLLRPRRLLLVDPALTTPAAGQAILDAAAAAPLDEAAILAANPRWHAEDAAERRRQFSTTDWDQMRQILVESPPWDVRPRLGELRVPTLFVLADTSELVPPAEAARIQSLLGDGSVVVIPNTTHSVFRDEFGAFMRVVDGFLRA